MIYRLIRAENDVLIADRYFDDSIIDIKVQYPSFDIENTLLFKLLKSMIPKPDYSVLLMIDLEEQKKRMRSKGEAPSKNAPLIYENYKSFADQRKWGLVLDGTEEIQTLHVKVQKYASLTV